MANKTKINYLIDFDADIRKLESALKTTQNALSNINVPTEKAKTISNFFKRIETSISDFRNATKEPITSLGEFSKVETRVKAIQRLYNLLSSELESIPNIDAEKLLPKSAIKNINAANKAFVEYNKTIEKNQKDTTKATATLRKHEKEIEDNRKALEKAKAKGVYKPTDGLETLTDARKALEKEREVLESAQEELQAIQNKIDTGNYKRNNDGTLNKTLKIAKERAAQEQKVAEQQKKVAELEAATTDVYATQQTKANSIKQIEKRYESLSFAVEQTKNEIEGLNAVPTQALEKVKQTMISMGDLEGANTIEDLQIVLAKFQSEQIKKVVDHLEELGITAKEIEKPVRNLNENMRETGISIEDASDSARELDNLKRSFLDFFSIGNTVQIFKNAVRDAFDTIKELDSAMTEIAVVSDFSIGDMWEELPRFTKEANDLGVAVVDLYTASALYVQQGKDSKI